MIDLERFASVKAIISDWDDTKVKTRAKVAETVDEFANSLKVPRPGEEGLLEFWGRSVEEIIYGLFHKYKPELSSQEFLKQYMASVPPNFCAYPIKGVEESVNNLHKMGFVQGVVSSGPKQGILRDIRLHYLSLEGIYAFIHGKEDTPKRKPFPEVFDPAFNQILYPKGIKEEQTVYVGDFHGDFDAAKARGVLFLGIVDNEKSRNWFLDRGLSEELMLSSFPEIVSFFEKIHYSR